MLERVFVVFVFFLSATGALVPLFREVGSPAAVDAGRGDPVTQALWAGVYLITALLVGLRWKRFARAATRDRMLMILVLLALISVLWSVAPEVTLRRGVALVGTTLFGAYLAARYGLDEQLRLLACALGISAVLSLLFALALPSYGISSDPLTFGDWQGVFNHKNALGSNMALAAMVFLILAAALRKRRWLAWSGCALAATLLVLSNSRTGLVVFVCIMAVWPLYRAIRWRTTLAVPFLIAGVLLGGGAAIWVLSNAEVVLGVLGRNVTLTGRTELWSTVLQMIEERPWIGYGYNAFWLGWEGDSAYVWLMTGSSVPAADNGFLDLMLDLGLLGLVVFGLGFSLAYLRAVALARSSKTAQDLWPLMFLTFLLLYSLTESVILRQNSLFWILYAATVLSVANRREAVTNGVSDKDA